MADIDGNRMSLQRLNDVLGVFGLHLCIEVLICSLNLLQREGGSLRSFPHLRRASARLWYA